MDLPLNFLFPGRAQWLGLRHAEGFLYGLSALAAVAGFLGAPGLLQHPHIPLEGGLMGLQPTPLFLARAGSAIVFLAASICSVLDRRFEPRYVPKNETETKLFFERLLTLSMKPEGAEALELAGASLGTYGRDPYFRFQRARLLLRAGKGKEARAELELCRRLDLGRELDWERRELATPLQETA